MRSSVLGFNQEALINYPHGCIKIEDVLLLNYIWNAVPSPSLEHIVRDGKHYVWLNHDKIMSDLPILNISKDRLRKKLQRLVDLQLIERVTLHTNARGNKTFYGLTLNTENLLYSERSGGENNSCSTDQALEITPDTPRSGVKNNSSDNELANNKLVINNKKKKQNLYDQCFEEIKNFTDDSAIQNALEGYLRVRIKEGLTARGWKGILTNFSERVDPKNYINAIEYSTQKNYRGIFNAPEERKQPRKQFNDQINRDGRYDNENHNRTGVAF